MIKILFTTLFVIMCWNVVAKNGDTNQVVCDGIRETAQDRCKDVSKGSEHDQCYGSYVDDMILEYNDNTSDLLNEPLTCSK